MDPALFFDVAGEFNPLLWFIGVGFAWFMNQSAVSQANRREEQRHNWDIERIRAMRDRELQRFETITHSDALSPGEKAFHAAQSLPPLETPNAPTVPPPPGIEHFIRLARPLTMLAGVTCVAFMAIAQGDEESRAALVSFVSAYSGYWPADRTFQKVRG